MKTPLHAVLAAATTGALMIAACLSAAAAGTAKDDAQAKIARGAYLVNASGCNDCHTPKTFTPQGMPVLDKDHILCGHLASSKLPPLPKQAPSPDGWVLFSGDLTAAVGPWGASFAANLTPDDQTGIGLWDEQHFIQALRTGKHLGAGRPILPPMPWFNFAKLSDDDLSAIFAYLKSLPPVHNPVPAPIPPNQFGSQP